MDDSQNLSTVELTVEIVSAFVSKNSVPIPMLPALISDVHASLQRLAVGGIETTAEQVQTPAVSVKKSITDDFIICLDDGKKFKSLRRHLAVLGMTPDQYRQKWNLPASYPMVAPAYSASRSSLAKSMGLGNARRKLVKDTPPPAPVSSNGAPKKKATATKSPAKGRAARVAKNAA